METDVATPRERYRAQVQAEIKQHAREQIATTGVAALSLKAIAKQMGMSGPALYRYFASRDELITALIRDAYRSLADAVAASSDIVGLGRVMREWALADPHRYFLIYGTPVPGYRAPDDTTEISREVMAVLIGAWNTAEPSASSPFEVHLAENRDWAGAPTVPTATLRRALTFWTRLHGVLSLELAGQFAGMGFDPALLYESELNALAAEAAVIHRPKTDQPKNS